MKKQEAIRLVETTFSTQFNPEAFQSFTRNLLKEDTVIDRLIDESRIWEAFRPYIAKYRIVSSFTDACGKKIDVLQVLLNKSTSLDRARTAQRNFVAKYLKEGINGKKDAALVAFVSPDESDWRFSLVKLEYSAVVEDGKLKDKEEVSPPKRWSFLVGKHEGSHTVKSRFLNLLENDIAPTLDELEKAFNIETVTNEFFKKYCELFFRMKESLDVMLEKNEQLREDFAKKEVSTVDFAKKTLGQIAFLYFLQKKGWFGVAPQSDWGTGSKMFLRRLFEKRENYGSNFFNNVLEPLFYEALAQDRGEESIYPRLNKCRMPFLNGGLFEPMNGYSWETTEILLPDELFSNTNKTKEGDIGDGILDIFDRYNFTVNENEPLEKEVAVDPEMLGKVFENLLDIKDRKSKGAFYTPREIVHYMCQQTLINYLETETKETIARQDLEFFIQNGDRILENDRITWEKRLEKETKGFQYAGKYDFILPESIRENALELDKLLTAIKVCDPAVGSGAFPLGMLNELVRARQALHVHVQYMHPEYYTALYKKVSDEGVRIEKDNSSYYFKYHAISHSIYGVDIDPGAVEIAKLRLWLALVVEENTPHPLPNLEHRIMQGNSLISEYEGIKLFDETLLDSQSTKGGQMELGLGKSTSGLLIDELQHKVEKYISESQRGQKQRLKAEIDELKWECIEMSLKEQGKIDKLEEIRALKKKNSRPFFIWKLEFSDVFLGKSGFDIVIGNPPYIRHRDLEKNLKDTLKNIFRTGNTTSDIYCYFYELSYNLLCEQGVTSFITSNKWMQSKYGKNLRAFLKENATLLEIVDLGSGQFASATVDTNLLLFKKDLPKINHEVGYDFKTPIIGRQVAYKILQKQLEVDSFTLADQSSLSLKNKIEQKGIPLARWSGIKINYGILTGKNEVKTDSGKEGVFIIDSLTRDKLIAIDINSSSIIHPVLRGKDVGRYKINWSGKYVIAMHYGSHENIDQFPAIRNHLYRFRDALTSRAQVKRGDHHWLELDQNPSQNYIKEFSQPKIIYPVISSGAAFTYDDAGYFHNDKVFHIVGNDLKYLLAILNSKLAYWLIQHYGPSLGNNGFEFRKIFVERISIPKLSIQEQKPFIDLVNQLLSITSAPIYDPKKQSPEQVLIEKKIDQMVFDLYELTEEERDLIINSFEE